MGIDRIGKGGAAPPAPEPTDPSAVREKGGVSRPFEVERTARANVPAPVAPSVDAASPLARLRAGEIDVHGYIDVKVDDATKHLVGLSPAELDAIKKTLRDQMATDPALVD